MLSTGERRCWEARGQPGVGVVSSRLSVCLPVPRPPAGRAGGAAPHLLQAHALRSCSFHSCSSEGRASCTWGCAGRWDLNSLALCSLHLHLTYVCSLWGNGFVFFLFLRGEEREERKRQVLRRASLVLGQVLHSRSSTKRRGGGWRTPPPRERDRNARALCWAGGTGPGSARTKGPCSWHTSWPGCAGLGAGREITQHFCLFTASSLQGGAGRKRNG